MPRGDREKREGRGGRSITKAGKMEARKLWNLTQTIISIVITLAESRSKNTVQWNKNITTQEGAKNTS